MIQMGLLQNIRTRLILLVSYLAISMGLLSLFGAFTSSGPLQSLFILTGWTVILYGLLHLGGWPLFVVVFLFYFLALSLLGSRIGHRRRHRLRLVPLSIHSLGAAVCFFLPGRDEVEAGFFVNVLAWIIPLAVALSYFFLDRRLTLRAKGAGGTINSDGQLQVK